MEYAYGWCRGNGNILLYKNFNQKHCTDIQCLFFFLHLLILHFVFFCNLCSYISMSFLECKHPHILNDRFFSFTFYVF